MRVVILIINYNNIIIYKLEKTLKISLILKSLNHFPLFNKIRNRNKNRNKKQKQKIKQNKTK